MEEITGGEMRIAFLRQEARVVERLRVIEVAEAESVTEAARWFACSRTSAYKLIARCQEGGLRAPLSMEAASRFCPNPMLSGGSQWE